MRSIFFRLNVLYLLIVTSVLAVSGGYSHFFLKIDLERRQNEFKAGMLPRLQKNLSLAMKEGDAAKLQRVLEEEMVHADIHAIHVFNPDGTLISSRMRRQDEHQRATTPGAWPSEDTEENALFIQRSRDDPGAAPARAGRLLVHFSRDAMAQVLKKDLVHKATEILLLDVLLVLALSFSLRLIFAPLHRLREGLQGLAGDSARHVEKLPDYRKDEIGDLARAFNAILHRLRIIIDNARHAEESARQASAEAAKAYEDLKLAQDSLLQAERLASLGGLVAGVAHEINTPVGITLTSASVLHDATQLISRRMSEGAIKKSDLSSYLETAEESARLIMANADRAAHLIQSFKQIAVDQTHEVRRSFGLHAYLDEIITSLNPRLRQSRVKVSIDCPVLIQVNSFPGALAQIISNLTMNSLIHGFNHGDEGAISIHARQSGKYVELAFSDTGKGIAPEHIGRVFDPFFTTQRGQGGTGLGLNVVFNLIAKQFGGTIAVASRLGEGARFTIRFPVIAPQEEYA